MAREAGDAAAFDEEIDRALALDKQNVPALLERARYRLDSGDLDGAERELKTLLGLDPLDLEGNLSWAQLLRARGKTQEAFDRVERVSARPDFLILIYPGPLGIPPKIARDAPPLFLLGAADDEYVAGVLFDLASKYHEAGASIETHIYAQGRHAFNMGQRSTFVSIRHWPERLAEWLEDRKLTTAGR